MVLDRQEQLGASGYIAARRSRQNLELMHDLPAAGLDELFRGNTGVERHQP
jgi:hypothetical protein